MKQSSPWFLTKVSAANDHPIPATSDHSLLTTSMSNSIPSTTGVKGLSAIDVDGTVCLDSKCIVGDCIGADFKVTVRKLRRRQSVFDKKR